MAECTPPTSTKRMDPLTLSLIVVIAILAVLGAVFAPLSDEFIPGMETVIDTLLNIATNVIYLIGGGNFRCCARRDSVYPMQVEGPVQAVLRYPVPIWILDAGPRVLHWCRNHKSDGHASVRRILSAYTYNLQPRAFQLNPVLGKKMAWGSRNRVALYL
jgi:hypothetical protein